MNRSPIHFHPIMSLVLALTLAVGSLAISVRSTAAAGTAEGSPSIASADAPQFPGCPTSPTPPCSSLQVFLLIDDSRSMRYSDPTGQRIEGVKNVLDILAREYYLPAVDAQVNDPNVKLPDIQVSLIHFSTTVGYNSGWKTINPRSLDEWTSQLEAFDADLQMMTPPQTTDFKTAFDAAAQLVAGTPTAACSRLVMLFTDGVPDLNWQDLRGDVLIKYMDDLRDKIQSTFNRSNDFLFVTSFGSGLSSTHRQRWEEITDDSETLDPRRVLSVPAREMASRMERIVASTIGVQVNALDPTPGSPRQYVTDVPALVASLRLTYYTIQPSTSFVVTGPSGKVVQPDGKNVIRTDASPSIKVMEILNPAPGSYRITATSAGGLLTELLRFERLSARFSSTAEGLLQFANGQIGIQLLEADGEPLTISPQMRVQARVIQAAQPKDLDLAPKSDVLTADWMPLTGDKAAVYACAALTYGKDKTAVLYNNLVGEIQVDPVTVKVGTPENACVPTEDETNVPLQLINAHSQMPAALDLPVEWTYDSGSTISAVDEASGQYVLRFKPTYRVLPTSPLRMRFNVTAAAAVGGQNRVFYSATGKNPISIDIQPPRRLALTLEESDTLADRLSSVLYRGLHPGCIDDHTEIVLGRQFFGWFGSTSVRINGGLRDITNAVNEPGIERFAVQLRSINDGTSSEMLSSWTTPQTKEDVSTLEFHSPGLGLYSVAITDQGSNPACAVLDRQPPRNVLLINDFWEYMPIPIVILFLTLLGLYLLRRYRHRRFSREVPIILSSIVLISLNVVLVNLLLSQTLKCQLNCSYLVDRTLNTDTMCQGVKISLPEKPIVLIPRFRILWLEFPAVKLPSLTIPILPRLSAMDPPLEVFRQSVARVIVGLIAVASLILSRFVSRLLNPESRRTFLSYLGLWALFFVIFCGLFFIGVAAK